MKRLTTPFFMLFVVLLCLSMSACGNTGGGSGGGGNGGNGGGQQGLSGGNSYIACPSSGSTTAAAPESGNVTLTVSYAASSPAEDALVQQNLTAFEQAHPNIKINISPING